MCHSVKRNNPRTFEAKRESPKPVIPNDGVCDFFRRARRGLWVAYCAGWLLAACTPAAALATQTPEPTATRMPQPTATAPQIEVDGFQVPDPQISNPEFFDVTKPDSPIPQFVNAMKMAGYEIEENLIAQNLIFSNKKPDGTPYIDIYGIPFVVALANFDPDPNAQGELFENTPLFLWNQEKGWQEATSGAIANLKGISIGSNIRLRNANGYPNELINQAVLEEFNLVVLDENFAFFRLERNQNVFSFNKADQELEIAQEANMDIRVHALLYGRSNFKWTQWLKDRTFTEDEMKNIIQNHISQIMTHYKGEINEWVVVNERGNDGDLYSKFFPEYAQFAFEVAEQTDPTAKLIYNFPINDFSSAYQKELAEFNKITAENKVFGIQLHIDGSKPIDEDAMIKVLKQYEVPIAITELDINMKDFNGTPEEKLKKQAELYQTIVSAVLESGVCNSISFWDAGDKFSWLEDTSRGGTGSRYSTEADGTLFFDTLDPKPSLFAVRLVLLNRP